MDGKQEIIKVLLIEDNDTEATMINEMLVNAKRATFDMEHSGWLEGGLEWLSEHNPDVILLDLMLPDSQGIETFSKVYEQAPSIPIIVMSGLDDEGLAVDAVREGAQDYLVKGDVDGKLLARSIRYAIERKQAEEELKFSRDYYRAIINGLHDQVLVIDRDYCITDANAIFLEEENLSREEIIGKPYQEVRQQYSNTQDSPEGTSIAQGVWETGQPLRTTQTSTSPDGMLQWLDVAASPLRNAQGQITNVVTAYRDVTFERRLENRLEGVHILGRALVLTNDRRQIVQVAMDAARLLSQIPKCELWLLDREGKTVTHWEHVQETYVVERDTFHLDDADNPILIALQSDEPIYVPDTLEDTPCIKTHPETRSILCFPLKIKEKRLGVLSAQSDKPNAFDVIDQRLLATLADYTALALENAYLYEETNKHLAETRALQEVMLASASTLDFDKVLERTIEAINEVLEIEHLGFVLPEEDELIIHSSLITSATIPDDEARFPIENSLTGQVYTTGKSALVSDTREAPNYFAFIPDVHSELAVPIKVGGHIVAILNAESSQPAAFSKEDLRLFEAIAAQLSIVLHNVELYEAEREQRKLVEQSQAQLVQSAKLAATGRMAASLAHEINNPLQAIHNSLQIMLSFPLKPDEQNEYLEMADEEVERLIKMVGRMLDFARRPERELRPTSLNAVIEKTLALSNKYLQHRHVTLRKDLSPDLPPVLATPGELGQVFLNLVLNAVDAMPEGGELRVSSQWAENGQLAVKFADNGCGIPPEYRDRIFDPFFSTKEDSTGLGLSISYNVIKRHKGEITIESKVGKGTTFTVWLPMA